MYAVTLRHCCASERIFFLMNDIWFVQKSNITDEREWFLRLVMRLNYMITVQNFRNLTLNTTVFLKFLEKKITNL